MKDILQEIVAHKRLEVQRLKAVVPTSKIERMAEDVCETYVPSLSEALNNSSTGIISEFKRRSPSKNWIKQDADASKIPLAYEKAGASALSILTDEHYFGGTDDDIRKARKSGVTLPVLYKNFIIDEYQLFQARLCGASAVLLIAACLAPERFRSLTRLARDLRLEVLLEMHSEPELEYAHLAADYGTHCLCGINNRHLGTFTTDVETSFRLAELLPEQAVKVSESGISNPETVKLLREAGYKGFLIGEHFMHNPQPDDALLNFISQL